MTSTIVRMNPSTLWNAGEMGYSQISIVEPGRMAYVSGQVAWRPNGEPVPADLAEQMTIVAANAKARSGCTGRKLAGHRYCALLHDGYDA